MATSFPAKKCPGPGTGACGRSRSVTHIFPSSWVLLCLPLWPAVVGTLFPGLPWSHSPPPGPNTAAAWFTAALKPGPDPNQFQTPWVLSSFPDITAPLKEKVEEGRERLVVWVLPSLLQSSQPAAFLQTYTRAVKQEENAVLFHAHSCGGSVFSPSLLDSTGSQNSDLQSPLGTHNSPGSSHTQAGDLVQALPTPWVTAWAWDADVDKAD